MLNGAFPRAQRMRMVGTVLLFHRPLPCCVVSAYVVIYFILPAATLTVVTHKFETVSRGIGMILISSRDEISSVARDVDERGTWRKSPGISREK